MESILPSKIAGKGIDADARVLPALVQNPGVTGMEAIFFWNFKPALLHHQRRGEPLGGRDLQAVRRTFRTAEVHYGKNQ